MTAGAIDFGPGFIAVLAAVGLLALVVCFLIGSISPATLYAYVSRGLIRSEPSPDSRSHRYRAEDVRDAREDRWDRREDRWDRRENRWDRRH